MSKKYFFMMLVCTAVFAFLGGMVTMAEWSGTPVMAEDTGVKEVKKEDAEGKKKSPCNKWKEGLKEDVFLGIVCKGKFLILEPGKEVGAGLRLTTIGMQEARPPESGEIDLGKLEKRALMVSGHGGGGGWLYGAVIIDTGGPIVTALVMQVFRCRETR